MPQSLTTPSGTIEWPMLEVLRHQGLDCVRKTHCGVGTCAIELQSHSTPKSRSTSHGGAAGRKANVRPG